MNFLKKWHFLMEMYKTPLDFLTHPKHSGKQWPDILNKFRNQFGGKVSGKSAFGTVLTHPAWPYVAKVFSVDDCFLRFVRFAMRNPSPAFPKFYGKPQRIVPSHDRRVTDKKLYLLRIEKLEPLDSANSDDAKFEYIWERIYRMEKDNDFNDVHGALTKLIDGDYIVGEFIEKKWDNLITYFVALKAMWDMKNDECSFDMWGKHNTMKRHSTGQYVIIDPLAWETTARPIGEPYRDKAFKKYPKGERTWIKKGKIEK